MQMGVWPVSALGQTRASGCRSTIGRLHFITLIPLTFSAVTTTTGDCYDENGQKGFCASGASNNFTTQVTKFQLQEENHSRLTKGLHYITHNFDSVHETEYNLTEALLFLSHIGRYPPAFACRFHFRCWRKHYPGAVVHTQGKSSPMHVWDNEIIDTAKDLYYNKSLPTMLDAILQNITNNWVGQARLWMLKWRNRLYADDGISLACRYAYRNATPGSILTDEYFLSRLPIVETRLARGGVRLAAILNRLFGTKSNSQRLAYLGLRPVD